MKSPCIAVCQIDKQQKMCVGCYRTLDEIGKWRYMSDGDRDTIMEQLPQRKTQYEKDNGTLS